MSDPSTHAIDEPPVSEGTHPVAMLGLVAGIAGLITATCICVYPPMAPLLPGLCGLAASGMGGWTLVRVRQRAWHESNRRQGTAALAIGLVDLALAGAWAWLLAAYGAQLGLDLGA